MTTANCCNCKKEFTPSWSQRSQKGRESYRLFCSKICFSDFREKQKKLFECENCGKDFKSKTGQAKARYCSKKCYGQSMAKTPEKERIEERKIFIMNIIKNRRYVNFLRKKCSDFVFAYNLNLEIDDILQEFYLQNLSGKKKSIRFVAIELMLRKNKDEEVKNRIIDALVRYFKESQVKIGA